MKWSENISEVHFHGKEIGMAYFGGILFWTKQNNEFWGKFTDDSTESDWWYRTERNNQISIAHLVNSETKEFNLVLPYDTTHLDYLFFQNSKLEKIKVLNTTNKIESTKYTFSYCTNLIELNLEGIDTSNVTSMESMFSHTTNLPHLNLNPLRTEKVRSFYNMFEFASNLEKDGTLDLSSFNTPSLINISFMFNNTKIRELKFNTLDLSNVSSTSKTTPLAFVNNCSNLVTISGNIIFPVDAVNTQPLNFNSCPLDNKTAYSIINSLKKTTIEDRYISFSETTYKTLTQDQIKVATDKGWTVTYK